MSFSSAAEPLLLQPRTSAAANLIVARRMRGESLARWWTRQAPQVVRD